VARKLTLLSVAYLNLMARSEKKGVLAQLSATKEAGVVIGFLTTLAVAYQALDRDEFITQVEYARAGRMAERTAQDYWARFKKAFPTEDSPEELVRHIISTIPTDLSPGTAGNVTPPKRLSAAPALA
jgi:hypothetical protein